jgi:amino acid adenylation domain-containing protein
LDGIANSTNITKLKLAFRMLETTFVASFGQQRLWFLDQLEPGTAAYNLPRAFSITGPLNISVLQRALQTVVARHSSLRTVFDSVNGECRQVVLSDITLEIPLVDLSEKPEQNREAEALEVITEESKKPFDLNNGPLLRCLLVRLGLERYIFLLVLHHIIVDGWSISILFRELTSAYASLLGGNAPSLPDLPFQYADYAQWQREYMTGEVLDRQLEYWKRKLGDCPLVLELPTDHLRPTVASWHGATEEIVLDGETLTRLKALGKSENCTLFMVVMAAFQALLSRYTNQESIVVGTPVAARNEIELEGMVGLFVNTLVFRCDFSKDPTFRELIRQVREFSLDSYPHQDLPFEKLVEALVPQRSLDLHPIFQVMFTFQNIPKQVFEIPGLSIKEIGFESGIAKFDLSVEVWDDGQLHCQFEHRTDLFEKSTIQRMLGHFENLLHAASNNPDSLVGELNMMSARERAQVITEWNCTAADFPQNLTIPEAFETQVERTPQATALIYGDRRWTYGEVNEAANRLAHDLRSKGIGRNALVGVFLERSPEMVVALMGILKSEAAYVPIDPSYPVERTRLLVRDAGLTVVVSHSSVKHLLPDDTAEVVLVDDADLHHRGATPNPEKTISSQDRAYVIYTSGSTGVPKGVEGTHRASMNRFSWMWRMYPFQHGEVCCQKTNLGFVDSIWEIFGPLLVGVPNVIIPQDSVRDPQLFLDVLAREQVTRIVIVPSQLRAILEHAPELNKLVPKLMLWSCSGEALPAELAKRFREAFPEAKMLNIYGSSEVAADATWHEVSTQDLGPSVPIGKPISNTQIYLVDRYSNAVPIGIAGEIHIGGAGLARGYLNQPELTAQRFVSNCLSSEQSLRVYRTGDLGRWRSTGDIEYLGRADTQVKLRGMRIELGEIESVLCSHPQVERAVVTLTGKAEQQKLSAYIVTTVSNAGELRRHVRSKLPEYMVPAEFWQLERLPLLPSGKVNRAALPQSMAKALVDGQSWLGPRNEVETQLAAIWSELLKVEAIGVDQNFFELGGHSLLVLQMTARIRRSLQVELPARAVFEAPTISELAQEVEKARALGLTVRTPELKRRSPRMDDPTREQLLAQLDNLSPAELQAVLRRLGEGKQSAGEGMSD